MNILMAYYVNNSGQWHRHSWLLQRASRCHIESSIFINTTIGDVYDTVEYSSKHYEDVHETLCHLGA